jgi:hypothetical protein
MVNIYHALFLHGYFIEISKVCGSFMKYEISAFWVLTSIFPRCRNMVKTDYFLCNVDPEVYKSDKLAS